MNETVLRISDSEDKDKMVSILKRNNYETYVELVFTPSNVEATHWKLTVFNPDEMGYVELDQINPNPTLFTRKEEVLC